MEEGLRDVLPDSQLFFLLCLDVNGEWKMVPRSALAPTRRLRRLKHDSDCFTGLGNIVCHNEWKACRETFSSMRNGRHMMKRVIARVRKRPRHDFHYSSSAECRCTRNPWRGAYSKPLGPGTRSIKEPRGTSTNTRASFLHLFSQLP